MRAWLAAGLAAVALASCSQRVPMAQRPAPAPSPVASTMHRQVLNAIDAGDGDVRVRQLRRKMAAEPGNLAVRLELARHYESIGCPEIAVEHLRLACLGFPDSAEAHLALAQALRMAPSPGDALRVIEDFAGRHPEGPAEIYSWLGILRDEMGDWKNAEHAHRAAITLEPRRAALHNNLGYNLLLQSRRAEAAAVFRQALRIEPRNEIARNNLGLALAADPGEALAHWQSVSGPASAHNNLAALMITEGRYDEARRELTIALSHQRDHAAALANLQLVAELDGGPVALPPAEARSSWSRFWIAVKGVFVSTKEAGREESASNRPQE